MSGNGALTGTVKTITPAHLNPVRQVPPVDNFVSCAAVPGAMMRGMHVLLTAAHGTLTIAAIIGASVAYFV